MLPRSAAASLTALLLTGAPALAQSIETVNVTAEHRVEDVESVPMAVSAFQADDIADHRLEGVRDIQFATPNINYTTPSANPVSATPCRSTPAIRPPARPTRC
jgi:iron complex outermembrane receptor protein